MSIKQASKTHFHQSLPARREIFSSVVSCLRRSSIFAVKNDLSRFVLFVGMANVVGSS